MAIFINKEGQSGFSPRGKISSFRLHRQIGGIYSISADTNELYEISSHTKNGGRPQWS